MERRKRRKPKVTVCRLMYDGSQKQDNRRRIRWTKGRKMTVSFKRNWGNKEQFVRKSKKGCVQAGDFSRSQRTLKMFQSAPPIRPLSAFGAFIPSRWNLLPSRFSIFLSFSALSPSLFTATFSFSAAVNHISYFPVSLLSLCPFVPLFTLLLFSLCWILNPPFLLSFCSQSLITSSSLILCQGIDLDPCSHKGDVTHASDTSY